MIALAAAIWDKVKHGSVDWLGIAGLFIFACMVFFLLFYFLRFGSQPPKSESGKLKSNSSHRLNILWAHYGAEGGPAKEVAEEYLRPRIRGDSLVGWVGSDLFGPLDPATGLHKRLIVHYSFDGTEATITRPEHALLVIPEDIFLKDQLTTCQRDSELNANQLNAELSRAREAYRQCEEERRANEQS